MTDYGTCPMLILGRMAAPPHVIEVSRLEALDAIDRSSLVNVIRARLKEKVFAPGELLFRCEPGRGKGGEAGGRGGMCQRCGVEGGGRGGGLASQFGRPHPTSRTPDPGSPLHPPAHPPPTPCPTHPAPG
jgi:hypothetical protein